MKRIQFQESQQTKFLNEVREELGMETWTELAEILEVNRRTLTCWKNEKYTLPENVFKRCLELTEKRTKEDFDTERKSRYWYAQKGALKGGKAVYEKYGHIGGDSEYRKKKWREWWEREGKFRTDLPCSGKEIHEPPNSKTLAEFVGIVLGDGGITDRQVTISLHKKKHRDYALLLQELVEDLFQTETVIYDDYSNDENKVTVTISSKNLVEFLLAKGLKKGDKVEQQVDVPDWIKEDIDYSKSCLRGLIDTDGGIYFHRHKSHEQDLFNIGLSFTNRSKPLLNFVNRVLNKFGFNPKRSSRGDDIFLYRQQEVFRYERKIGFHNNYHAERVKEFKKEKLQN